MQLMAVLSSPNPTPPPFPHITNLCLGKTINSTTDCTKLFPIEAEIISQKWWQSSGSQWNGFFKPPPLQNLKMGTAWKRHHQEQPFSSTHLEGTITQPLLQEYPLSKAASAGSLSLSLSFHNFRTLISRQIFQYRPLPRTAIWKPHSGGREGGRAGDMHARADRVCREKAEWGQALALWGGHHAQAGLCRALALRLPAETAKPYSMINSLLNACPSPNCLSALIFVPYCSYRKNKNKILVWYNS